MNLTKLRLFFQLTRPLFLFGAALLYALGVGIARYLGATIDWDLYLLGQAWVSCLQLSIHYLNEFYDYRTDADNPNRTLFSGGSGAIGLGKLAPGTAQLAGATCLTITAALTVPLLQRTGFEPVLVLLLLLAFLGAFFYSVPPVRLSTSGYGELTTSILVANLVPALGFYLQHGDLHRLLPMVTFPLTALHMAMMLAFELPDYASDLKHEKTTLLIRLGWQRGLLLHNQLILAAFLLLGLAAGLGLPLAIALPAFMPLPLGLLQIWQMRRITAGGKPNWTALTLNGVALMISMAYLLAFSFWTR